MVVSKSWQAKLCILLEGAPVREDLSTFKPLTLYFDLL
jgi:hypothetical protein